MRPHDRSVDVFVKKVRQKLGRSAPDWTYIHTHFGVGYRFAPERVDEAAEAGLATDPTLGVTPESLPRDRMLG